MGGGRGRKILSGAHHIDFGRRSGWVVRGKTSTCAKQANCTAGPVKNPSTLPTRFFLVRLANEEKKASLTLSFFVHVPAAQSFTISDSIFICAAGTCIKTILQSKKRRNGCPRIISVIYVTRRERISEACTIC